MNCGIECNHQPCLSTCVSAKWNIKGNAYKQLGMSFYFLLLPSQINQVTFSKPLNTQFPRNILGNWIAYGTAMHGQRQHNTTEALF